MIYLILAIAGAWVLLEIGSFVLAIITLGIASACRERRDAREIRRKMAAIEPHPPELPPGEPLDDQGRPYR